MPELFDNADALLWMANPDETSSEGVAGILIGDESLARRFRVKWPGDLRDLPPMELYDLESRTRR